MAPRLQLHEVLKGLVDHVYFQPPPAEEMEYPCFIYHMDADKAEYAGNVLYQRHKRYQVTVVDRNPDSNLPDQVAQLPLCAFDRFFAADNLNHWVFNLFF